MKSKEEFFMRKNIFASPGSGTGVRELWSLVWIFIITLVISSVVIVISFFPARVHSAQTTQSFTKSRFALETAEINVNMQQPYGKNTQKMLFKLDTSTGEVWVMQISTISITNPQILSAGWVKVTASAKHQQF